MYPAILLFTLALIATTLALPIANPDYVATAVVTENDVVVVTVTAGSPEATINTEPAAITTPVAAVTTSAAPVPTTHYSAPAATTTSAVSVADKPAVFAQVKPSSAATSAVQSKKATSTPTSTPATTLIPSVASVTLAQGGGSTNGAELTITLINSYGKAISTSHVDNDANTRATGVNGNAVTATTMAPGATGVFAVPIGWGGNVAIADAAYEITDNDSLLEGSYSEQGTAGLQSDIDVSYVNGFSVPIICKCLVQSSNLFQKVSGIATDLFAAGGCTDKSGTGSCGTCAQLDGHGACINPKRGSGATDASVITDTFFEPAAGSAYTFPYDGDGGNNGNSKCAGAVTCCVGTSCA